ncbi:hypothetical protein [Humibacillus xanthopallidus]|uniref:Uncharacterized protein n=1 Tax=Humibacillus xanthopallidus TaxID=412689 RepID=A0A543HX18_9MICO|nr:hypothetical protein [Humibacillus xanthopallidus]TQM62888.1 hypothetical protein FBY41_2933 [Humibacillus xanthopallidus]
MPHQPSYAQTFTVTVPEEADARLVADELAARGHALVAVREVDWAHRDPSSSWFGKPTMRPHEQGQWDVTSVATGPLPDDDESWWQAQEDAAVRRVAQRFGGRSSGSGSGDTATVLRVFTRVGLVHELDDATAGERRLASLAESPARVGTAERYDSDHVDEELPDGPGDPVRLPTVDAVDWAKLEHAYGSADDVPQMLAGLAANDDQWGGHLDDLVGSVTHQGSSYSSTAPALRVVAGLALAPQLAAKRRLDLLFTLFLAAAALDQALAYGYRPQPHHGQVRATVVEASEALLTLWPSVSRAEQRLLLLLAALDGHPVPPHDLADPASRLAATMIRDEDEAVALLEELARSNEELIELAEGRTPRHSRLVAALEVLLWDR